MMMSMCQACIDQVSKESAEGAESEILARQLREREIQSVAVTTTPAIEGRRVVKTIDVITAECVLGIGLLGDILAAVSDLSGGRSESTQKALRELRRTCLRELRLEAFELGANAVVGVSLNYSQFSGQGKSMLFLVASGTAVQIEPAIRDGR